MSRTKTILIVEERIVERHTCFGIDLIVLKLRKSGKTTFVLYSLSTQC
jgi:hypothetical protein